MGFILFHGNDLKRIRVEVKKFETRLKQSEPDMEWDTPENPSASQIQEKLASGSLFSEKQLLKIFEPEKITGFEKILAEPTEVIVLLVSYKETNPFKKAKGMEIIPLNLPKNYELEKILKERFRSRIQPEALEYLSRNLSSLVDLEELEEEMKQQKIAVLGLEEVYRLKGDTEAKVFLIVDAMIQKKAGAAVVEVFEFLQSGGFAGQILGILSSQLEKLYLAKKLGEEKRSEKEIQEILGGHPFVAKKMIQNSRQFSLIKLESLILSLAKIDFQIRYYDKSFTAYFLEKLIFEIAG